VKACQLGPEVNHHFALTCNPQQGTKSVISCVPQHLSTTLF